MIFTLTFDTVGWAAEMEIVYSWMELSLCFSILNISIRVWTAWRLYRTPYWPRLCRGHMSIAPDASRSRISVAEVDLADNVDTNFGWQSTCAVFMGKMWRWQKSRSWHFCAVIPPKQSSRHPVTQCPYICYHAESGQALLEVMNLTFNKVETVQ